MEWHNTKIDNDDDGVVVVFSTRTSLLLPNAIDKHLQTVSNPLQDPLLQCSLVDQTVGSAITVEHIFSGGCDTISLQCASLKAETIKAQLQMARLAIVEILSDD